MKKYILFIFSILAIFSAVQAQETDAAYIRNNFTKKEIYITMRDGIRLFTTIYTPRDTRQSYPILLKRTPYTCAPYGADTFPQTFQNMHLARSGYIFVMQDVRGRWMSEGQFVDVRPIDPSGKGIDESTDTYDTVEWLVKNAEANNGKVGVYGISYPGFYASNALVKAHPSVKAVSPQAPVTDWFIGDDFHHNGAFMMMDAFRFYLNFGRPHPRPVLPTEFVNRPLNFPDNYDFYLKMGALPNYKAKYMGDSIAFWNDLMAHPNYDAWWKARNIRPHLQNVQPAVMTVGGLFDAEDCYGAWQTYLAIEKQNPSAQNRIVMGPWFHGGWGGRSDGAALGNIKFGSKTSEFYQKEIEKPFFDFHLKGIGNADATEAYIFETGSNEWKKYASWTPKGTTAQKIFLQPQGKLNFAPPSVSDAKKGKTTWISDPNKPVPYTEDVHESRTREYMTDDQRFAARRPDVLVFETEILTEDMTLAGAIDANLWFSTDGTDADLVVKVIDVLPDDAPQWEGSKVPQGGYQMLVRGEIMRGRFRNSFEKPEAFAPNKPTEVKFQLPDVAHTFKKGHRLMIQIQSSWFPLVDRNPQKFVNIYQAKDADFEAHTHTIFHNNKNASYIVLPILK